MFSIPTWFTKHSIERPTPKRYPIPKEHILDVLKLADFVREKKTLAARYQLWVKLAEVVPVINAKPGVHFSLNVDDVLCPCVEEVIE